MKELVARLLSAAYNISHGVEPGDQEGEDCTAAAIKAGRRLAKLASLSPGAKKGVIVAAKVFLEIATDDDPEGYVTIEEEKGLSGRRFEDHNAGRVVSIRRAHHRVAD
jgi:hypothetical protein